MFWRKLPSELTLIPVISIVLIVNSIISIVKFFKSISIDEGRLLFTAPIKGWELICSKYLEFISSGLILIILTIVGTMITGGNINLLIITSMSILWGFFILFILITSLSVIFKSYFSNTGICIVLTVVSMVIISGIISILELVTYFISKGGNHMKYVIRCRESGDIIENNLTFSEALEIVRDFESEDFTNGTYTPDFYEIAEEETEG